MTPPEIAGLCITGLAFVGYLFEAEEHIDATNERPPWTWPALGLGYGFVCALSFTGVYCVGSFLLMCVRKM